MEGRIMLHELEGVMDRAVENIFQNQKLNRYWNGDIYYNAYPTAVALITNKILNISEPEWERKALAWIAAHQRADGSWGLLDKETPPHPDLTENEIADILEVKAASARNTVVCLLALEIYGGYGDHVKKAKRYMKQVDEKYIDPFTDLFLAYFGRKKWEDIAIPPIEVMLAPKHTKFYFKTFIPAWVRDGAMGGIIVKTLKEKKFLSSPFRKMAIKKAEKSLLENQLSNGGWFGTFQPSVYPMLALKELGYDINSNVMQKGLAFLRSRRNPESGYVHRFWLSVWDTSLTLLALKSAGIPDNDQRVQGAVDFLIHSRFPSNAWGFCPEVDIYPDCDDTSVTIQALDGYYKNHEYLRQSVEWLIGMQNSDGGWGAFIRNQAEKKPGTLPTSVEDSLVILKDPACADITGHVLRALGENGYTVKDKPVKRALAFLKRDQLPSGAWYGRWGLCYIYAVSRVLRGLYAVREDMDQPYIQKAVNWLLEHQNLDGGWGEHYLAYFKEEYGGVGSSSPVQTAWAVSALLLVKSPHDKAVQRGVRYLLDTQTEDGNWPSPHTVGALEIYENTNYAKIFPLMALGDYRSSLALESEKGGIAE